MDHKNSNRNSFRNAKVSKVLAVVVIITAILAIWAINVNISEEIKTSYRNDSQAFVQRFNSYMGAIEAFNKEPTMETFADTQKHFGFLATSVDNWDMSISLAVEKAAIKDIDKDFLYESWSQIRKSNDAFIESVTPQNRILTYDQTKISRAIDEMSSVCDSIKTVYHID